MCSALTSASFRMSSFRIRHIISSLNYILNYGTASLVHPNASLPPEHHRCNSQYFYSPRMLDKIPDSLPCIKAFAGSSAECIAAHHHPDQCNSYQLQGSGSLPLCSDQRWSGHLEHTSLNKPYLSLDENFRGTGRRKNFLLPVFLLEGRFGCTLLSNLASILMVPLNRSSRPIFEGSASK